MSTLRPCNSWTVTGTGVMTNFSRVSPETEVFSLSKRIAAFFAMTLATNIISAHVLCKPFRQFFRLSYSIDIWVALILYRIWSVDRATGKYCEGENTLRPVLVVESGAIYSAFLVALLATFVSRSWAEYIVLDAVRHLSSFAFVSIYILASPYWPMGNNIFKVR